jgi:tetratricopeptide (TPR) repeat protein
VEALRQHVMAALAARLDPRLAPFADLSMSHAVSYEAYREFLAGDTITAMGGSSDSAIAHYGRAYALDTNFTLALVEIARISRFMGPCERTDSIADALRPRHDRLPPFDRLQLDWLVADCHGQREKALVTIREQMTVAPRSDWLVLQYAWHAWRMGHLREAIAVTEKLNPPANGRMAMLNWSTPGLYWRALIYPYHLLGEHRRELEVVRQARRALPGDLGMLHFEARALVGLGRLADLNAVIEEMARMPAEVSRVQNLTGFPDAVGCELRAHGYRKEAQALFEWGIRWIRARPAVEQQRDPELRYALATLLYDRERWDEARQILKQLAAETPSEMAYQGMIGAVAARQGDRREVARIDRWLARRTGRYLNGEHTVYRARLAAILGDRDHAVELYRQALDQGYDETYGAGFGVHADPDFESVRDYPPFQELVRPKD